MKVSQVVLIVTISATRGWDCAVALPLLRATLALLTIIYPPHERCLLR